MARHLNTSIIVSCDFDENKNGVLLVGVRHTNGKIDILNAFDNEEAWELWHRLVTVNKKEETNGRSNSERKED